MKEFFEVLTWDSEFLNQKVARVFHNLLDRYSYRHIVESLQQQHIDLAYYTSSQPLDQEFIESGSMDIKLVDEKVTFFKTIQNSEFDHKGITPYQHKYPDKQLLELAVQSGIYSRFNIDERIGKEKFEAMYKEWIINSVNKKLAKEVLVQYEYDCLKGFVTLGEKNQRADIGIIAVDTLYRGKGIGKNLMLAAENWFAKNTCFELIQVVTQRKNISACNLYKSCGYEENKVEYFYHIWN